MNLPGYDAWKLASPYEMSAKEERRYEQERQEDIDSTVAAYRTDLACTLLELRESLKRHGAELVSVTVDVGTLNIEVVAK
jgi:hypothetical protein